MAKITKAVQQAHRFTAALIPADVMKAISQAELLDRLEHAELLSRKARNASDRVLGRGYSAVAKAALTAQPRAVTERQVAELTVRAAATPNSSQADAIRRQAQRLLEEHPPAPRRADSVAVAKAKAAAGDGDDLMVCYDQNGTAYGVIKRSDLQPVRTEAADVAAGVAKARSGPKAGAQRRRVTSLPPGRR